MPPANSKTAPLSPAKGNPSSTALAELRAALPISLSALARRCGYSKASLSLLFAKGQLPSTPHIRAALLAAVARELKALNLNPAPILHLSKTQTETPTMDPFTLNFFSLLNNPFSPARVNAPADAESANAQLLIRGGFVDQLMAGAYTYLPLGLRVLQNIQRIADHSLRYCPISLNFREVPNSF